MIRINLLPVREKVKEENIRRQISIGVLLVILAAVVMAYFWFQKQQEVRDLARNKAQLEQKLARLKKEVGDLGKIKKQKEALDLRKKAIAQLSKNRLLLVRVLDQISALKPETLYFLKLEQKNNGDPWQDFTLIIKGVAVDNAVIAQFMKDLQKVKKFKVDLDYTKAAKQKKVEGEFKEFQLRIQVAASSETPEEEKKGQKKG
jgi:type IV pilus assembly protein PilN